MLAMKALFVSDIHIIDFKEPRGLLFLNMLKRLKGYQDLTHLFLVGDIFDLWIANHHYFINRYSHVINELRRLQMEGVEIHYFEGNHDLYLKSFWSKSLGFKVHEGPETFKLGKFTVRVEHGDQSDPEDKGYKFLRWFLRTPVMRFIAHSLPGAVVAWIGEWASEKSRKYTSEIKTVSDTKAIEKLRAHAQRERSRENFDILINGHVHVRDDFQFEADGRSVRAVNLGSWFDRPEYFFLSDQEQKFIGITI